MLESNEEEPIEPDETMPMEPNETMPIWRHARRGQAALASDVSFAEMSYSLLSATLCHHSHAMLLKCLTKPSARSTVADTALLPRLLAPTFFDAGASARLVLHVTPSGSMATRPHKA